MADDPNLEFLAGLAAEAEGIFKRVEEGEATVFMVATIGPCPEAEDGKHRLCRGEAAAASLVAPTSPARGIEVSVVGCERCDALILEMAPFGHDPRGGFTLALRGCGIEPCTHGREGD